jgi:hypothetical protein
MLLEGQQKQQPVRSEPEVTLPMIGLSQADDTPRNEQPSLWQSIAVRKLAVSDAIVVFVSVLTTQIAWLGWDSGNVSLSPWRQTLGGLPYYAVTILIVLLWLFALYVTNSRDVRILGSDSTEYSRVASASLHVFGIVAMVAYFAKIDLARGFIALAFPVGTFALLISRWLWRKWLNRQWSSGKMRTRVLISGSLDSAQTIADRLLVAKPSPYDIAAIVVPASELRSAGTHTEVRGHSLQVIPFSKDVSALMDSLDASTLILSGGHSLSARAIRDIQWSLKPEYQRLVISSGLTGVGAPRLAVRPVAGLPLLQVEPPVFTKPAYFAKRTFDIVASGLGIILISPFLLIIALAVKLGDGGPIIFKQERVGLNGQTFNMLKFRSMRVDAEKILADLKKQQSADAGNSVMFKMKDDPRVTKVGKFLRRYSLDELPQLFNVLNGTIPLRILKTRPEFSEKSMGAFALPAKSSTNKGKAFSQVVSCFANGLRMRRISKFNCNRIRGMEAQFLAKPVFGAVCA